MAARLKWDRKALDALEARVAELSRYVAHVGVLKNEVHQDEDGGSIDMVELAAIHEFGSPKAKIPERSFIRSTFRGDVPELVKIQARLSAGIMSGKTGGRRAVDLLGIWGATQVKKKIASGPHIPPPLKEATVRAKGSTRPLVDTGRLLQAIAHRVVTTGSDK